MLDLRMNPKKIVKEKMKLWSLVNKLFNKEIKERVLASQFPQKLLAIIIRKKLSKLVLFKKMN
jgi:hypothetical protein